MTTFAERLKYLKIKNSLKQNDIANILNSKDRVIIYYEKGERTPLLDKLIVLADFFDVSLDYLVCRTEDPRISKPQTKNTDN